VIILDNLDVEILKILLYNSRRSYESIARKLKISSYEVKKRMTHLENKNIIKNYSTNLNFPIFGKSLVFTLAEVKKDTIQEDLILDIGKDINVVGGAISLENKMQIMHTFSNAKELERNIKNFLNNDEIEKLDNYILLIPGEFEYLKTKIREVDWKIIKSLKNNSRKTEVQIAKELGISTKTVKRRISYLKNNGIIFFMIDLDTSSGDLNSYSLIIKFHKKNRDIFSKIKSKIDNIFFFWNVADQDTIIYSVLVDELIEIERNYKKLIEISEIKEVINFIPIIMYYFDNWLDDLIDEMNNK
jgi:DNA-binding Lrp family transcriptional regulator